MRVLVIENHAGAPAGLFGDWLRAARGAVLDVVGVDALPERAGGHDLVVTLGSPSGAWEDIAWVHRQRRFLQESLAAGTPVVGICFGAQLLATAIGGRAAPMEGRCFVGWHACEEVADPVWRGPWVRWHGDHLEVPADTEVLARDRGTVQAFHHRAPGGANAVGVQFHPEASAATADFWATKTPDMLARAGADPATIARDGAIHDAERDRLHALFAEMLRRALASHADAASVPATP
jgi:GMP synthase (glutamine-hydrolysing)